MRPDPRLSELEGYAESSPLLAEGVSCASCVFLAAGRCELFGDPAEPDGACRFWLGEAAPPPRPRPLPLEVHACIRVIAEAGGAVALELEGTPLGQSRTARLLRWPSPTLTTSGLVSGILVDLMTEGDAFIRKHRDADGDITRLSLLRPRDVEVVLEGAEPAYAVSGRQLTRRDVTHVRAPVHDGLRGLAPLAQAARAGLEVTELTPTQVARLFRVPPPLLGLSEAAVDPELFLRLTVRPWLVPIQEALGADEDLFPRTGGLSPTFRLTDPPPAPVIEPREDHSELLAAMLEVARREVPAPQVTVEAPQVTVSPPAVQVDVHQAPVSRRVERDEQGHITRVVEERARAVQRDEQGNLVGLTEE